MRRLYYRFIYGRLMKLAHRFNWHHTTTTYPEGDTLVRCQWCGLASVIRRRDCKPAIWNGAQSASAEKGKP